MDGPFQIVCPSRGASMRKRAGIFLGITIAIAGVALSVAQEKSADTQASGSASLTSGTLMVAELSRGLNTRHLKVGDIVKARVAQDVLAEGRIVVPRDSTMLGRVVEVKKSNKEDRESRLVVMFEQVRLRRGRRRPLQRLASAYRHCCKRCFAKQFRNGHGHHWTGNRDAGTGQCAGADPHCGTNQLHGRAERRGPWRDWHS